MKASFSSLAPGQDRYTHLRTQRQVHGQEGQAGVHLQRLRDLAPQPAVQPVPQSDQCRGGWLITASSSRTS
jgi:hypothetical protein